MVGGCGNEDRHRHRDRDVRNERISEETREQGPRRGKPDRQDQSNRAVDPEKIAGLKAVHFIALNDSLIKAI